MRLYWVSLHEAGKATPNIQSYDLKGEGMFIAPPGIIIFRKRQEADNFCQKYREEQLNYIKTNMNSIYGKCARDSESYTDTDSIVKEDQQ